MVKKPWDFKPQKLGHNPYDYGYMNGYTGLKLEQHPNIYSRNLENTLQ